MILEQKFFKDKKNNIFCLDIIESNKDTWNEEVKKGWISITEEEAKLILNPPLTPEEIEAQNELQKQQKIAVLNAELNQLKQDMIFAQMMGDDISEMKGRVLEIRTELELLEP